MNKGEVTRGRLKGKATTLRCRRDLSWAQVEAELRVQRRRRRRLLLHSRGRGPASPARVSGSRKNRDFTPVLERRLCDAVSSHRDAIVCNGLYADGEKCTKAADRSGKCGVHRELLLLAADRQTCIDCRKNRGNAGYI